MVRKWDWQNLLFVTLLMVYLIPIWWFQYFPSADGPAHISNAGIIRDYNRPEGAIFREYYSFNPTPEPNWSGHLIMAALMYLVPPLIAEKLLVSICIILLPISIRFGLGVIDPKARFLAFLGFPFAYSSLLHDGLYNFCLSLPVFFFVWGCWLKQRDKPTVWKSLGLGGLCILLYFCHLISLVMAGLGIAVMLVAESLGTGPGGAGKLVRRRWLFPALAILPCFGLVGLFLTRHGIRPAFSQDIGQRLLRLVALNSLITFDRIELVFSSLLALLFGGITLYALREKVRNGRLSRLDSLVPVILVYTVVYLVAPDRMSTGAIIPERLLLYPFFALLLWLGTNSYGRWWRTTIPCAVAAIGLSATGYYASRYAELNGYLKDYLSGMELIAPNSTILPIPFDYHGHRPDGTALSIHSLPFWQAGGYISAQRHAVDLRNYEAVVGHFPLVFRPERNPKLHVGVGGGLLSVVPRIDFLTYPERTGGRVDYVLLWLLDKPPQDSPEAAAIYAQLASGYDLIHVSPRGLARLYKRKGADS